MRHDPRALGRSEIEPAPDLIERAAAADAQAAADRANAAVSSSSQAVNDNAAAVSTLQSTVKDLKGNQESLAVTVSDETAKIKAIFAEVRTLVRDIDTKATAAVSAAKADAAPGRPFRILSLTP